MPKNTNSCDCELCLYKTFPLDNPLVNDQNKIVEAIVYHFIFRLGNLVKSKKELNSHIVKFITTVNHHYLTSSDDSSKLKETIYLIDKKIADSGKGCHFSTNTTLNKHIQKEATYLKLIISSMEDDAVKEQVEEIEQFEPVEPVVETVVEQVVEVEQVAEQVVEQVVEQVLKDQILEEVEQLEEQVEQVLEEVKQVEQEVKQVETQKDDMVDVILEQTNEESNKRTYCSIS